MITLGVTGKIIAGMVVVILIMGGGFYAYFKWSQDEFKKRDTRIANAETALATATESFENLRKQVETSAKNMEELGKKNLEVVRETSELRELLSRHDLNYLASEKPGLIERRVNAATKRVLQQLRDITSRENEPTG